MFNYKFKKNEVKEWLHLAECFERSPANTAEICFYSLRTPVFKTKTWAVCSALSVAICELLCETEKSNVPHLITRSISMNRSMNVKWSIIFCLRSRFYLLNNINQRNELSNSMCNCIRLQHEVIHWFPVTEAIEASCLT